MKYKILERNAVGYEEIEVDGEPVHFSGFEQFTFFSHHEVKEDIWGNWDDWNITEISSGCSIGGGFTLEEAIHNSNENLSLVNPEQLQVMIDKFIKEIKK